MKIKKSQLKALIKEIICEALQRINEARYLDIGHNDTSFLWVYADGEFKKYSSKKFRRHHDLPFDRYDFSGRYDPQQNIASVANLAALHGRRGSTDEEDLPEDLIRRLKFEFGDNIKIQRFYEEGVQRLDEAQRGEWWIYPGGQSQFADGDVGDSGHEGYVIEHVANEIYEHFLGNPPEQMGYLSDWEEDLKRNMELDENELDMWERKGPTEVIIERLLKDKVYSSPEQANFAVYIAWGSSSKDARDYAMKYLGWKRMTTGGGYTNLQTWLLRPNDMEDMRRGVFDAWGDYGEDEEEDKDHTVTIEVRANNKVFSDIPLSEFEKATVRDIIPHMRQSAWMRERKQVAPIVDPVNFTQTG